MCPWGPGRGGAGGGTHTMRLAAELESTLSQPFAVASLAEDVPDRAMSEALKMAKEQPVRRRALPAEVVIWLVIAMALMRERCIRAVLSHLKLPAAGPRTVTSSAIVQARNRLGEQPMAALFGYTADEWALSSAEADRWHGLALFGTDGTCLRVADTPANEEAFGRPGSSKNRGPSGYPQLRLVGLMALRSHLLYGAAFGSFKTGECTLAKELWYLLPDQSLVIIDRGFIDYGLFHDIMTSGSERHFLCRAKKNLKLETVRRLGPSDELVRVTLPRALRKSRPELPESIQLRAIRYQVKGFQPQTLLTSLIDADAFPAEEVVVLYHERWELEVAYDEVKTHTLEREEALRSRAPERVRQELWGLLIAYNLVRRQIERFAQNNNIHPLRVSFRAALLVVRNTCVCAAQGVGSTRALLDSMNEQMKLLVLPERRDRRYRRCVKVKMSAYPRNAGKPPAKSSPSPN